MKKLKRLAMSSLAAALCVLNFNVPFVAAASASDIRGHWAEYVITQWLDKQYINGYANGTFQPDRQISRAEFVKLANKAFGFNSTAPVNFKDVSSKDWFYNEIAKAKAAGYISGYADGTFGPNKAITRQEAAAIIARAKKLSQNYNLQLIYNFRDANSIESWSQKSISAVVANQYMNGYPDGTFRPNAYITRAEAVVTLNNAITKPVVPASSSYNVIITNPNSPNSPSQAVPSNLNTTGTVNGDFTIDKSGTYGPSSGTLRINGDVEISASRVTLRNIEINGKLEITKDVGSGNVDLKNVVVTKTTNIYGGGPNSIYIDDSKLDKVYVDKKDGKIRLVASGDTEIEHVELASGAKLEEINLDRRADGFTEVTISDEVNKSDTVTLIGDFDKVTLEAKRITVQVNKGTIDKFTVNSKADDATIELSKNAEIEDLVLNAKVTVKGFGSIDKAQVNVSGCVIQPVPNKVEKKSNVTVTIGSNTPDTTPPAQPSFTNLPVITKNTDLTAYTVSGVGEKGARVYITISDGTNKVEKSGTVGNDGKFTISLDISKLTGNTLIISAYLEDAAGNKSNERHATIVKDTEISDPTINTLVYINNSNKSSFNVSGTGKAGATVTVELSDGQSKVAQIGTVASNGSYSVVINASVLNDGTITVSVKQSDKNGNVSGTVTATTQKDVVVQPPIITTANAIDANTNQSAYTVQGTGEPEATVNVALSDGTRNVSSTALVGADGTFTATVNVSSLAEGQITISVSQTDKAGNASTVTTTTVQKDTTSVAVTINNTGYINASTNQTAYAVTGTGKPNAQLQITVSDGVKAATAIGTVNGNGTYSVAVNVTALNEGTLDITVIQFSAGTTTTASASVVKDVSVQAPVLQIGDYVNASANLSAYSVYGTAEPGAAVELTVAQGGNQITASGTANAQGQFNIPINISNLADGQVNVSAVQTDVAGNTSAAATKTITKDTVSPAAPQFASLAAIDQDNVNSYTISGSAEPGAAVNLTITDSDNNSIGASATANASGAFSTTVDMSFAADGIITIKAKQTDAAGNQSAETVVTVNKNVASTIDAPTINQAPNINMSTNQSAYVVSGMAVAGATVQVTLSDGINNLQNQTVADSNGDFSITFNTTSLQQGNITLTAVQTHNGKTSETVVRTIVKDTIQPAAPNAAYIILNDNASPDADAISGAAQVVEANAIVQVYVWSDANENSMVETEELTLIGTANANADGSFNTINLGDLNAGTKIVVAAKDAVGNESAKTTVYTLAE